MELVIDLEDLSTVDSVDIELMSFLKRLISRIY